MLNNIKDLWLGLSSEVSNMWEVSKTSICESLFCNSSSFTLQFKGVKCLLLKLWIFFLSSQKLSEPSVVHSWNTISYVLAILLR